MVITHTKLSYCLELLTAQVLKMAHDELGHNGTHRTYMLLKQLYYWKRLKQSVVKHIQKCYHCQQ